MKKTLIALTGFLSLAACTNNPYQMGFNPMNQSSNMIGMGLGGAAAGAGIGAIAGHGRGAVIGSLIGGAAGALAGNATTPLAAQGYAGGYAPMAYGYNPQMAYGYGQQSYYGGNYGYGAGMCQIVVQGRNSVNLRYVPCQ